MRTTGQTPINRPAAWAFTGAAEALAIAEDAAWAGVLRDDARGELQRQIALVRDRWRERYLAEHRD